MKSPMAKIHLLDLDEPLACFNGLKVRCEVVLAHAETVYVFGEGLNVVTELSPNLWMRTCKQCLAVQVTEPDKRKYAYGLVEAQEEKFMEVAS